MSGLERGRAWREWFGLKWNPFSAEVSVEGLYRTRELERLLWRLGSLIEEGGFGTVIGEPGLGKSTCLRQVVAEVERSGEAEVVVVEQVSGSVTSFYQELGHHFGLNLSQRNRWGSFRALRAKWRDHVTAKRLRPLVVVDEAQQMNVKVLTELRLLSSMRLDSCTVLSVILGGDQRLVGTLRREELLPLGSRVGLRVVLEEWEEGELRKLLQERVSAAGRSDLVEEVVARALVKEACGIPRRLLSRGNSLLKAGAELKSERLTEELYLRVFGSGEVEPRGERRKK